MKQATLLILFLQIFSGIIYAQDCDKVLLTTTKYTIQSSSSKSLSWLKLINSSNYEENKTEIEAQYKLISGSYGEFNSKRNKYLEQQNYSLNTKQARLEVMEVVGSSEAIKGWTDCKLNGRNLYAEIVKASQYEVTIEVGWLGSSDKGILKNIEVRTSNPSYIASSGLDKLTTLNGKKRFVIKRSTSKDIHIGIDGEAGAVSTSFTTSIEIPQYIKPPVKKELVISDNSMDDLKGFLNMNSTPLKHTYWSKDHCKIRADESLRPATVSINQSLTKLSYSFQCVRRNAAYNCGGGWHHVGEDSYNSSATADLEYNNGVLYIKNIQFDEKGKSSDCGDLIKNHLKSKSGTPINLEFVPKN